MFFCQREEQLAAIPGSRTELSREMRGLAAGTTHIAVLRVVVDATARREDVWLALGIEASLFEGNNTLADLLFSSQCKNLPRCVGLLNASIVSCEAEGLKETRRM